MMRTGARWSAAAACMAAVAWASEASAQQERSGLAAYDYENLGLGGLSAEVFVVYPNDTESAVGFGGRIDLGYLGPGVRVMIRGAYWSSELKDAEVNEFEERIADLVEEQDGTRPTLDLGVIDRSAVIAGLDFHWMFAPTARVRPYLGLGGELYVLSGSGAAIDGTFVDDSLDLLTVGASAAGGLEVLIVNGVAAFGEVRGSLAADIRSIGFGGGLTINW